MNQEFTVAEGKITDLRIGLSRGHADDPFPALVRLLGWKIAP